MLSEVFTSVGCKLAEIYEKLFWHMFRDVVFSWQNRVWALSEELLCLIVKFDLYTVFEFEYTGKINCSTNCDIFRENLKKLIEQVSKVWRPFPHVDDVMHESLSIFWSGTIWCFLYHRRYNFVYDHLEIFIAFVLIYS